MIGFFQVEWKAKVLFLFFSEFSRIIFIRKWYEYLSILRIWNAKQLSCYTILQWLSENRKLLGYLWFKFDYNKTHNSLSDHEQMIEFKRGRTLIHIPYLFRPQNNWFLGSQVSSHRYDIYNDVDQLYPTPQPWSCHMARSSFRWSSITFSSYPISSRIWQA